MAKKSDLSEKAAPKSSVASVATHSGLSVRSEDADALPDDPAFAALRASIVQEPFSLTLDGDHKLILAARALVKKLNQAGRSDEANEVDQALDDHDGDRLERLVLYHFFADAQKRENMVVLSAMSKVLSTDNVAFILEQAGFSEAEARPLIMFLFGFASQMSQSGMLREDIEPNELQAFLEGAALFAKRASQITMSFRSAAQANNLLPKWENEKANYATAEAFLVDRYGDRLGINGDLTMAALGRLDPSLLNQLNSEFRGEVRRAELHKLLPTVKERTDAKLLARFGYIPRGAERRSKLTVMAREAAPALQS